MGAYLLDGLFLTAVCLRVSVPLLAICGVGAMFCGPITQAASQAIWQAKVALHVQGRVFALSRTISMSISIIALLLAAPLADYIFKPARAYGGALVPLLGPIIGIGSSRGIGVLISLIGLLIISATLIALIIPPLRRVEVELPDHDLMTRSAIQAQLAE